MDRLNRALVALLVCGGLFVAGPVYAKQAKTGQPPAQTPPLKPILTGKFVPPLRGMAEVQYTKPKTVAKGKQVITTFEVKNMSAAPIAGFTVSETWYDKQRALVPGGGAVYRHKRLLQPGEVITITLTDDRDPRMDTNPMLFSHAYGQVHPKQVSRF